MAAFGGGTGANQASYQVTLKDAADYEDAQDRIDEALGKLDGIGDTTIAAGDGFGSQDLSVVVKAADGDILKKAAEAVRTEVATIKDVTDVQSDLAQSVPRISVTANDKAAAAGFDSAALGGIVAGAVRGTPAARRRSTTPSATSSSARPPRPPPWPS